MKTKTTYVCEICHTEYADKGEAQRCEVYHIPLKDMKIVSGKYQPVRSHSSALSWPSKIVVQDKDGNRMEYRA